MAAEYLVPAMAAPDFHETEQIIRRSRFLAQGSRCASREEAKAIVAQIRGRYPDATHHCWAFVAGPPGCTAQIGSSDDGEPHGTAGRPMLNILLHCGIGQICVVISRWFGGIKLGTGGLARAYGDGTAANVADISTVLAQSMAKWTLVCSYGDSQPVRRALRELGALVSGEIYESEVTLMLELPESQAENMTRAIADACGGRAKLYPLHRV